MQQSAASLKGQHLITERIHSMRRLVVFVLVLASLMVRASGAAAQDATPDASPQTTAAPLDLPALMLTPADLEAAGFPGYGADVSELLTSPESLVASYGFADEVTDQLQAAGFQRIYAAWLRVIDPETGQIRREVYPYIEEYADAAGAERGFDVIQAANIGDDPAVQIMTGTHTVGERSQLVRYGSGPASGTPVASSVAAETPLALSLDLEFRLGPRNAGVMITDFTGTPPDVAEVETLADALLAKLEAAPHLALPGLSVHALRLDGAVGSSDAYVRQDGVTIPVINESPDTRQVRDALYGSAAHVYRTYFYVPAGDEGVADDVGVQYLLLQFPDAPAAAAYLAELPAALEQSAGFSELTVQSERPALGDDAIAVMGRVSVAPAGTQHVEVVAVQQGPAVSFNQRAHADGSGGV
jgi:hypothetical protein